MKIPSTVRISPKIAYEVVYVDSFPDALVLGECRYDSKQIVLKKGLSERETLLVFIHELYHFLAFETKGLVLTEAQVLLLEKATYRLLKLNKWI